MLTTPATAQSTSQSLRDLIRDSSGLAGVTERMANSSFAVGPDDLIPLVFCGHKIRAENNNKDSLVEGTCAWCFIAHSLTSDGMKRVGDLFIEHVGLMQDALSCSAFDPSRVALADSLKGIKEFAECEKAVDRIAYHFRSWDATVIAFWDRKDLSDSKMPEGSGNIERAGDVVAHFCNRPVCQFMFIFENAFGPGYSELDIKWMRYHNPRKTDNN